MSVFMGMSANGMEVTLLVKIIGMTQNSCSSALHCFHLLSTTYKPFYQKGYTLQMKHRNSRQDIHFEKTPDFLFLTLSLSSQTCKINIARLTSAFYGLQRSAPKSAHTEIRYQKLKKKNLFSPLHFSTLSYLLTVSHRSTFYLQKYSF